MSGTNFRSGVCVRKQYSGSNVQGDKSKHAAATKLIKKSAVIRCDAQTVVTQTAFVIPANAVVRDVLVNVITPEAVTVDVGVLATINSYLATMSLANAGPAQGSLADGAITLGAALYEETGTGADVAYARRSSIIATAQAVYYQVSAGAVAAVFDIMVEYDEVVVEVQ